MLPLRCRRLLLCHAVGVAVCLFVASNLSAGQASGLPGASSPGGIIVNAGQWDDSILACARGQKFNVWLTASGILIDSPRLVPGNRSALSGGAGAHGMEADPGPQPTLRDQYRHHFSRAGFDGAALSADRLEFGDVIGMCTYFIGNVPEHWVTDVPVYNSVICRDLFPEVDLVLAATDDSPIVSFKMRGKADKSAIRLAITDAKSERAPALEPDADGFTLALGSAQSAAPASLDYSTFLGATGYDAIFALGVGSDGAIYAAGNTESSSFPTANAYDPTYNGGTFGDVFLTKIPANGQGLVYSTFIGGGGADILAGMLVDDSGRVYLTGVTGSSGTFPLRGAYDSTYAGLGDVFVLRLNAAGNQLQYSTYVGGSNEDYARAIAVDASGSAYVCGHTRSTNFPTAGGIDPNFNGGTFDAFMFKLGATGASLPYSSYLGGGNDDQAFGIAVDAAGRAYLRGWTASTDFPPVNALDATFNGGDRDVFLARVNAAGSALDFSTYLGGDDSDYGVGLELDLSGNICIAGVTRSSDFPLQAAYDSSLGGLQDLFVARIAQDGGSLLYSTFLGGSAEDFNGLAAVDGCGHFFVTGYTYSTDFPMVLAYDSSLNAGSDIAVAGIAPNGASLHHSTYLGGGGFEFVNAIVPHGHDVYLAGVTNSADFPMSGAYDSTQNGDYDGFIAALSGMDANNCCFCQCDGDPACDGIRCDILDVVSAVNVAFRNYPLVIDPSPSCPIQSTDVNCSGATDVIDVVKFVNVAFRNVSPTTEFCDPCAL